MNNSEEGSVKIKSSSIFYRNSIFTGKFIYYIIPTCLSWSLLGIFVLPVHFESSFYHCWTRTHSRFREKGKNGIGCYHEAISNTDTDWSWEIQSQLFCPGKWIFRIALICGCTALTICSNLYKTHSSLEVLLTL